MPPELPDDPSRPLRVSLAGTVSVEGPDGRADDTALPGGQARLTFAALVLERRRLLPRDQLAELLWPERLPGSWESALRNVVSRVRDFLDAAGLPATAMLRHDAGCYRLALPAGTTVDVEEAERLVDVAADRIGAGDAPAAVEAAASAHRILTLPVLPGVNAPWLDPVRDRLGSLALRAGELEAEARLLVGDRRAALATVEAVIDAAPFRETAHRIAMRVHESAGNRAEGLRAYERCRRLLAEELGVDPSPETEALYLRLLGSEPAPPAPPTPVPLRPTGTVTFVFGDVERSAAHWARDPEGMTEALQLLDEHTQAAVEAHGGRIFRHTGEGVGAVFAAARDALAAAVDAQRRFLAATWPTTDPVRVRLGVHTGEAETRGDDYAGPAVARAQAVCAASHGGQVLTTAATRAVVGDVLPPGTDLRRVGELAPRGLPTGDPMFQVVHADLPAELAFVMAPSPTDDDPLLGRGDDLARVDAALRRASLVTVTGPGGVGKTRLALAVASATDVAPPDRRWWVDLASTDAASVSHVVADVVGASHAGVSELDAAITELRQGPSLVVLDNCEHVVGAARDVATALRAGCSELAVLATSQAPLDVPGEEHVELLPLAAPDEGAGFGAIAGSPAVEVFARRARAANASFELTPGNGVAIAEICRRLDGLPLALELAAARVRSLRPDQIAAHLDERFRLVRRSQRDDGSRHSSLDATVRWSYDLLSGHEQRLFDRLSLFLGVFDLDGAMAVAGAGDVDLLDVLESLDSLVERSMLVAVESPTVTRYRLLETLRAFGRLGLEGRGELADARARHRDHHLALAEAGAVGVQGPDEPAWVETLHRVLPDVRAGFAAAAADGDVDTCLRTVVALFDYAFFRLQRQVGEWAAEAVSLPGAADHPAYGDAAAVAGYLAWARGDLVAAERWALAAMAAGSVGLAAEALGTLAVFKGQVGTAIEHWEHAADAARGAGNPYREAISLGQVAFGTMLAGGDEAVDLATAAKEIAAVAGSPSAAAHASWALGIALYDRDPEAALAELEAAMALGATVDNRLAIGSAKVSAEELRTKLARRSRVADVRSAVENLEYWVTAGHPPILWSTVRRVARTLAGLGEHRWAAFAIGAEEAAELKLPLRERERVRHEAVVAGVRAALGNGDFEAEVDRGRSVTPERLVADLRAAVDRISDS